MRALSWRLAPEDFIQELVRWRAFWRRRSGGGRRGARRAADLSRCRAQRYSRVTGFSLRDLAIGRLLGGGLRLDWTEAQPEDLKIVLVPEPDAQASSQGGAVVPTKVRARFRRTLREAAGDSGSVLELINAGRARRRRLPTIGRGVMSGRAFTRALVLESVGAVIVPDLTDAQVSALEASGAVVIPNSFVDALDPVGGASTPEGETEGKKKKAGAGDGTLAKPESFEHLEAINVAAARAKGLTGKGALIGFADTGIDASHPEFAGRTIHFRAYRPNGEVDPDKKPRDYEKHGTHVAGICAGVSAGVAPDAELAVAAVLTTRKADGKMGGYLAQILAGLDWLALGRGGDIPRPVDVLNASLSMPGSTGDFLAHQGYRLGGVLVVAAIGNDGAPIGKHTAPGKYACSLGVGAIDSTGKVADFSAWGGCFDHPVASSEFKPDLMAPGVQVVSAVPGTKYEAMNGTSMATPCVSGAGALLIQQDPTLQRDADALCERILSLTMPLPTQPNGYDERRGGRGRLALDAI